MFVLLSNKVSFVVAWLRPRATNAIFCIIMLCIILIFKRKTPDLSTLLIRGCVRSLGIPKKQPGPFGAPATSKQANKQAEHHSLEHTPHKRLRALANSKKSGLRGVPASPHESS